MESPRPQDNDDYEIDDDRERVDLDLVWEFMSGEAYWARWRTRADVEHQVRTAWRILGAYETATGRMAGFARAFSDGVSTAYLADVFVTASARGQGLGARLVGEMVERGPGASLRWMLHTADAHGLYSKFGFRPPDSTYLERPRPST
ncbi:GNAT family N-acetyltransferase [Amycolatopsis antarctica]|uniref:GNAT family N-acetyltransferase n=1 Tax=Amycolatopsis antarctica TaxID=1854586 RepID=A0A263CYZ2_9PSEU|nr:GNAT family N-acetyltransferase [Amycolatopsis antarctica]OZM71382.1 GNAT family N-acetyltransferase [Amycolatopsis antarctica]